MHALLPFWKTNTHTESVDQSSQLLLFYPEFFVRFGEGTEISGGKNAHKQFISSDACCSRRLKHSQTHTQRMTECNFDGWHNVEPACECVRVCEAPYVINNVDIRFRRAENEQEVIRSQNLCSPFFEVCIKLKECNSFIQQKNVDARRHDDNNYRAGLRITDWTQTRTLVAGEGRGCTVYISLLILLIDGNCVRLSLSFRQTRHTNGPEKWWNRRFGPKISHWFIDVISSHALPVLQFISLNNCRRIFRFCFLF